MGSPIPCSSSTGTAWSAHPRPWLSAVPALPWEGAAEEEEEKEGSSAHLGKGSGCPKGAQVETGVYGGFVCSFCSVWAVICTHSRVGGGGRAIPSLAAGAEAEIPPGQ